MISTLVRVGKQALREIAEEKKLRRTDEVFLLFSLGSQFDHLIKQAIERLGLFCLVADPSRVTARDVEKLAPIGIILSGGPVSVYKDIIVFDSHIFDLGIPVLGICLGFQKWANHLEAAVIQAEKREFGVHTLGILDTASPLFEGCGKVTSVLQSHGDRIEPGTRHIKILAETVNCPISAGNAGHLWGVQFHPEVSDTVCGQQIFRNFCFGICGAKKPYPAKNVAARKVAELRKTIGKKKVLLALSGGSDSSTVAFLLKKAMAGHMEGLRGIYIKGIDRPDDEEHVRRHFSGWMDVRVIDATDRFLAVLAGKTGMHEKRVAMRGVYKQVLEEQAAEFGAGLIAQGTLYTDISESGGGYDTGAKKAQIKIHHNVKLDFSLPELLSLSDCVKDTGRDIGRAVGVP